MKAWTVAELGEPADVLRFGELAEPEPGPGQVVVAVEAAACNFADILYIQGKYQEKPALPFTPGLELAGTVTAAGEGAAHAVGDRVYGAPTLPHGAFAERAVLGTDQTFPWPDGMSAAQAASFYVSYQTGWCALVHRGGLVPGETLLVHAAAGGVGAAAVQLGKACGAVVLATVGRPDKVETARRLGADHVLDPDGDLREQVLEITGGRGVDVVYDPVGGDTFDASRRVVAWEGRLLVIGFAGGRVADAPTNHALVKNYSVVGVHWAAYQKRTPQLVAQWAGKLARLAERGRVAPLVGGEWELERLPEALAALGRRDTVGRIVLRP